MSFEGKVGHKWVCCSLFGREVESRCKLFAFSRGWSFSETLVISFCVEIAFVDLTNWASLPEHILDLGRNACYLEMDNCNTVQTRA